MSIAEPLNTTSHVNMSHPIAELMCCRSFHLRLRRDTTTFTKDFKRELGDGSTVTMIHPTFTRENFGVSAVFQVLLSEAFSNDISKLQ